MHVRTHNFTLPIPISNPFCHPLTSIEDVYHLMIDPSHQRQGIGKQLMEAAISAADRVSIPTFIVSSRESHSLYLRLGFKDLASRVIDNEAWAKEVCRVEQESGQSQFADLQTKYFGITEKEHLMVRWPIGT